MLRKFCVENYRNFNEKAILDLTNKREYSFNTDCIKHGLISKTLIVGENGCGKTNLAHALFDIHHTLTAHDSNQSEIESGNYEGCITTEKLPYFSYEFQNNNSTIVYSYRRLNRNNLAFETLSIDGNNIFEFDYLNKTCNYGNLPTINSEHLNLSKLDGSIPALRFIIYNTIQPSESHITYLKNFAENMLYFRQSDKDDEYIGMEYFRRDNESYIIDHELINEFESFLKEFGIEVHLEVIKSPIGSWIVQDISGKKILFKSVKSAGIATLENFFYWNDHFRKASFICIDGLESNISTSNVRKLLRYCVKNIESQVVFTSHNTSLLDTELMRPDCYLILKEGKLASFADSTCRELRMAHNLEKIYRNGEFD